MRNKITVFILGLLAGILMFATPVMADTDEILNYTITVDVNDDATLNLNYHIDWKVLDSGSGIGPLTWMKIGIPNSHVISTKGLSSTVDHINRSGNYVEVYLDRKYYEGDVASVDFLVIQDYMYQVNKFTEGETVYSFTPGWFDDIRVDELVIRWNNTKAVSFQPECVIDGDYNEWTKSLSKGDKFTVSMTYPNDAYGFDLSKSQEEDSGGGIADTFAEILGSLLCILVTGGFVALPVVLGYLVNRGFGGNSPTINKTTRTKVTYYDSCPGCGAPRKEGAKFCEYCGKSLVKSEETITEEQLKKEEKAAAAFTKNGEFRYGSSPNTFIRVSSVRVPNPHYHAPSRSSSGRSHSSCAHSSCACACACACAGGGRAGCTMKDFYNTNLKLSAIAKATGIRQKKDKETAD
ncbi:MAG: zinc ribbon domain-containing protein [Lachnospiraceae bacterium]|nr:zinc ribbon domain-containing protein [Lachnospiraceae bacterium]